MEKTTETRFKCTNLKCDFTAWASFESPDLLPDKDCPTCGTLVVSSSEVRDAQR